MESFPRSVEDVTTAWLNQSLTGSGTAGTVTSFSSERIGAGIGLLGKLDRINLQWEGGSSNAPSSVVAKFATDNEEALGVVKIFNFYEKEVNFYSALADQTLTRTPACHAASYDRDSESFVLLLEDVSAGEMGDQNTGATQAQVEATVEELVKLHASWWASPTIEALPWINGLDHPLYTEGIPQALDGYHPISSQILDLPDWYDRYRSSIRDLLTELSRLPWTLCHGDARLDNLFYGVGDDSLVVLDWQLTNRSCGIGDIAYFMSQSVPIDLRRELDHDVVSHYRDRLIDLGVDAPTFEELWHWYRLSSVFCLVYPVVGGGTVDPNDERALALVRTMLDRCVAAAEDLDAVTLLG